MSLASRIADLTTAIATALNARVPRVGASSYDVAVLNGYTGTQAQFTADMTDPGNTDYAAQFNAQILASTLSSAGIATESTAGATQFATAAEINAGTSATKAVSALQLATTYDARIPYIGTIAQLQAIDTSKTRDFKVVFLGAARALLYFNITSGKWFPVTDGPLFFLDTATRDAYSAASSTIAGILGVSAWVNATNTEYRWDGTSWNVIDNGTTMLDRSDLIGTGTSWNTLTKPGIYLFNGGQGNPQGFPQGAYNYGHLIIFRGAGGLTQMYFPDANSVFYWRHGFSGAANGIGTKVWNYHTPTGTAAPTA